MRMQRLWRWLVGAVTAGVLVTGWSGIGAKAVAQGQVEPEAPSGRALVTQRVRLTRAQSARLPRAFARTAALTGWRQRGDGYVSTGPLAYAELTNGRVSVFTDGDGYFPLPEGGPAGLRVVIRGTGRAVGSREARRSQELPLEELAGEELAAIQEAVPPTTERVPGAAARSATATLGLEVPFLDCCFRNSPARGSVSARNAMDGRCLDYNGVWTDGGNYPRSDWRAFRNFVGSDCDLAFFRAGCWRDHFSGGCWAVHGAGGCSAKIGHAWSYHRH